MENSVMIEVGRPYRFRKEFCPMLGISDYQVTRRKKDLLAWLTNFYGYDFEESASQPAIITIKEIIGEYQQMPRKLPRQDVLNAEKQKDYTDYAIASLTPDFQPESGWRIARNAIRDFGYSKYGHTSQEWVARIFVMPVLKEYGEKSGRRMWVWYPNYKLLNKEELNTLRTVLKTEKIDEEAAAEALCRQAEGEDISGEFNYFQKAMGWMRQLYGKTPVCVNEWRHRSVNDSLPCD